MTIVWRDHWQNIELKKIVYIKKTKIPPCAPSCFYLQSVATI